MSTCADFDAGPLSWVKGEIDLAMRSALESLHAFAANPRDGVGIRSAQAHLHQARGALQIVGLDGVTRLSEELEALLADMQEEPSAQVPQNFALAEELVGGILGYLDSLLAGSPSQPLGLFPLYRRLLAARARPDADPVDLYFPRLSGQPPPRGTIAVAPAPEGLDKHYREQRGRFQRGLIGWFKGEASGAQDMRAAVEAIELAQTVPAQRVFWWVALAFFDALVAGALPEEVDTRRLCNRIDQQLRRLVEGSQGVAERLLREALYQVAHARPATAQISAVQEAFQLKGTLPRDEDAPSTAADPAPLKAARETLTQAKDAWNKYASGNPPSLIAFRDASSALKDQTADLGNPDVAGLAREIAVLGAWLSTNTSKMSEAIALEVATGLLLLENALANFASLGAEFEQQSQFVCARLKACVLGRLLRTAPSIPPLDQMSRKAQEGLVLGQVVAEIQAGLRSIEQVLESFFRDPARRDDLTQLGNPLHQVKGALDMLGEKRARDALAECEAQIGRYAQADCTPHEEDFERIARTLAGLGFYIEALAVGKGDFDAAMRPVGATPAKEERAAAQPSAETGLVQHKREAPPPSPEATRLIDASAEKVDGELLGVYLEEAGEVLAGIREQLELARAHPADTSALTAIRRAFHTLKGSGRMVGLARLGEAAWAVEQTMNLWLHEERAASGDLLSLVRAAHDYFADNVARLKQGGASSDASALLEFAARVKRGEPSMATPATGEAAPAMAAPVPPDEELVAIGGETVSRALFDAFATEAGSHLEVMARELEVLAQQAVITDALIRAAHTLAGISATVKLEAVRELGHALEQTLEKFAAGPLSQSEEKLIGEAVGAVSAMVAQAVAQTQPAGRPDLIARLRRATIPALADAPGRVMLPEEEGALAREPEAIAAPPAASVPMPPAGQPADAEAPLERRLERRMRDELDPQLVPLLLEEANDLLPAIGEALRNWRANSAQSGLGHSLQRLLHTLKGGARMAGAMGVGELTHHMETSVEHALSTKMIPEKLFDALEASYDRLGVLVGEVHSGKAAGPAEVQAPQGAFDHGGVATAMQEVQVSPAMLRVRAEMVDRLVNQAGEVSIARSRIEGEMRSLRAAMEELTDNVMRLRAQLREIEIQAEAQMQSRMQEIRDAKQGFDPLEFDRFTRFQELTRLMAESVNDVQTVHQNLVHAVDETEAGLLAQARLNRDLQQNLMRVRMVPFSSLAERLYRIVRQTAKELGKRVNLDIRGAQLDMDRSVLERITAPLEHLLRNAVTHGIEYPAERAAKDKPEIGEVRLEITQEGNEMRLAIDDDGQGLDMARIREQAAAMGLLGGDAAPPDREIAGFIFRPGFTTATVVTEVAGRGVGMDVVRTEVVALGGRIDFEFAKNKGTRFTVYLPLTLAVTRAVLVKAAGRTYAIPAVMVEQVQQLKPEPLAQAHSARHAQWQSRRYPFHFLPHLLGAPQAQAEFRRYSPVLFLRSGSSAIALHVDEIVGGSREIVVKPIGPQLRRIAGIAGATVLGSGEIVLILNPVLLALREAMAAASAATPEKAALPAARPIVMVVDDSLTVRKVTDRLLAREGYEVIAAKDGVEAMEKLQEIVPAVMLVDIEMPRMDGFDLTRNVRADPRLAAVPIIFITSRTAEKHRNYAKEIGASAFLGKPYQEDELLGRIAGFVEAGRSG